MRVVVHDYCGHPFQVQLSRGLARRGHQVLHLYASFFQTPHGSLEVSGPDPPSLAIEGIALDAPFAKYSFVKRLLQERQYGRRLAHRVAAARPDVVLSANTPLDPQSTLLRACQLCEAGFAFWVQDVYSLAVERILRKRSLALAAIVGARFRRLERQLLAASDVVIAITEDFVPTLLDWGAERGKLEVIRNWAPLDQLPRRSPENPWAEAHGLLGRRCALYAGTLGLKHDPALLLELARRLEQRGFILVVISEGPGADWLASQIHSNPCAGLKLLPFQPFDQMPDVLGSAGVLLALLEPEAGTFSVPSKVLTYLCAGRPIVAAMPRTNLVARIIDTRNAGRIVEPGEADAFGAAVEEILDDQNTGNEMGRRARDYAEEQFEIEPIVTRFETLLARIAGVGA